MRKSRGPFVYRLGRKIFILERGVRLSYGLRKIKGYDRRIVALYFFLASGCGKEAKDQPADISNWRGDDEHPSRAAIRVRANHGSAEINAVRHSRHSGVKVIAQYKRGVTVRSSGSSRFHMSRSVSCRQKQPAYYQSNSCAANAAFIVYGHINPRLRTVTPRLPGATIVMPLSRHSFAVNTGAIRSRISRRRDNTTFRRRHRVPSAHPSNLPR